MGSPPAAVCRPGWSEADYVWGTFSSPFLRLGGEQSVPKKGCSDTQGAAELTAASVQWWATLCPGLPACRSVAAASSVSSPAVSPRAYRRRSCHGGFDVLSCAKFGFKWGGDCAIRQPHSPSIIADSSGRTESRRLEIWGGVLIEHVDFFRGFLP